MPFTFNRYSGLLLVFFFHGFVYAFLLLRKGLANGRSSDKWLSFFLLLCILYIAPWMLGFAGWYDGDNCTGCRNFMFYAPLQHTLLMGPAIYFYLLTLFQPSFRFQRRHRMHFLPAALYLMWCAVVVVTDRLVLKRYYLMNGDTDPDFDTWYILAGLVSLLIYLLLCLRMYGRYRRFIFQQFSFADELNVPLGASFFNCLLPLFLSQPGLSFRTVFWGGSRLYGHLVVLPVFCLLFYYIAINGYTNSIETRMQFRLDLLSYKRQPQLAAPASVEDVAAEDISHEEVGQGKNDIPALDDWKQKVQHAVITEKAYANPELTLADLAKHLEISTGFLSRIINTGFGQNFNDFINHQRVEDVRQKLQSGMAEQMTIMSIAYEAGFNSKATFNRAFKKATGKNPKDFLGKN